MKPDIKKRWLEALRSGEYEQGREALRIEDRYCCLGVLCDIATADGVGYWQESDYGDDQTFVTREDASAALLPVTAMEWAGLGNVDPMIRIASSKEGYRFQTSLSSRNDAGDSFEEIAKYIEEQL